jgi:hypothetical protein
MRARDVRPPIPADPYANPALTDRDTGDETAVPEDGVHYRANAQRQTACGKTWAIEQRSLTWTSHAPWVTCSACLRALASLERGQSVPQADGCGQ